MKTHREMCLRCSGSIGYTENQSYLSIFFLFSSSPSVYVNAGFQRQLVMCPYRFAAVLLSVVRISSLGHPPRLSQFKSRSSHSVTTDLNIGTLIQHRHTDTQTH